MSSLTPVRDDHLGAARPFGLWTTRSASWFPAKRRRDPGLGPLFNVAWLRRDPNLGQIETGVRRFERAAQRAPSTLPHGIAAKPTGRGTLRLLTPPPSAAHGCGRPWACLAHMSFRIISSALGVLLRHLLDCSSDTFG